MLAARKLSKSKITAYLVVLFIIAAVLAGYMYKIYAERRSAADSGLGASANFSQVANTKFNLQGLNNFDAKFFNDQRFKNLSELYKQSGIKSEIGRNNPFESFKKASSTPY